MSINFPTSLDSLTNPAATDSTVGSHASQHGNANDAIEAIEAKIGVDSSAVTSSLDYKLKSASSVNPGHKHTFAGALTDVAISDPVNGNGLFYNGTNWYNADVNVADSSTTVKGVTKLSSAPASATDPIAVGDNDTRVPTQGENDALAGTSGTPSSTNKYVTSEDVAENTASKVIRRKANSNVTVPSTPTDLTDATSKTYVDTQDSDINTSANTNMFEIYASDNLRTSSDTSRDIDGDTYTKYKEILLNDVSGIIRVKFTGGYTSTTGSVLARIYKNGVALGTEQTLGNSPATFTEDLTFARGDYIQLYAKETGTTVGATVSNLRLYYDKRVKYTTNTAVS